MVGWELIGATKVQQKRTMCSYTSIMYPLMLEIAQKVVESVDNIITRPCETLQSGSFS